MNVNFEEITEIVQERLSERFAFKVKVSQFNLDPLDSDTHVSHRLYHVSRGSIASPLLYPFKY